MGTLLLIFVLVGVCFGDEQKSASPPQANEVTWQGRTLNEWVALAKDKDANVRRDAADALGKINLDAKAVAPVLSALLKDKDFIVRRTAASALTNLGPDAKAAVPVLASLLKDNNSLVRQAAAEALGQRGVDAEPAIPALTESLKDTNGSVRQAAARALGKIGVAATAAVPALIDLARDQDNWVRQAAVWSLGKMGPGARTSVPVVTELLRDKDDAVREAAARSLGQIGPSKSAMPALIKLLTDDRAGQAAAETLGKIGAEAKTAVPALAALLKDKRYYLKIVAAPALGQIGPEAGAAVPALVEALQDMDIRNDAVWALGEIGPEAKTSIPALSKLLKDSTTDSGTRQAAARALARIGLPAIPVLIELCGNDDERVQWLAVWALGEMDATSKEVVSTVTELLRTKSESTRLCVVQTLGEIGPHAKLAVPALTRLLKDKEVLIRRAAVKALMKIDPQAKEAVAGLLKDDSAEVRDVAANALGRSMPEDVTEADRKQIKGLIAELATIDSPDFGLSASLTGDAFAPIPSSGHFGMGLLTQHGLKTNPAFVSLVELGPKALPFLLESLDDKTPTKLEIKHGFGIGGMWFGHEISGNAFNRHEANILAHAQADDSFLGEDHLTEYTVKVGDICFVVVGQITNRSYNAVRYQPTACIVINSTVQDRELAAQVRAIWGKSAFRQKLLDSLLIDYNGDEDLQVAAAMRLAYYFPEATEDLLVARLKELEVADSDERVTNVRAEAFVKAVSWVPRPKIRAGLLDIFRKTADPPVLLAALPVVGKDHNELAFRRITALLDRLPKDEPGPFGNGYHLLVALGSRFPGRAEGVFQNFLKPGTIERRRAVVHALRETCGHLAVRLLAPLLEDKRDFGWSYAVKPKENEPRLPIRVCDEAAETIATYSKELKFVMEGSHENLDRQIKVMQQQIDEMGRLK